MVSVMLYPCIFFVALLINGSALILCVACMTAFGETISNILGVVVIFCCIRFLLI